MVTLSDDKLPLYQVIGRVLRINHSEQIIETKNMDDTIHTEYQYITAVCDITSDRSERISSIIGSKYTPSAEIATINNQVTKPELYQEYQDFRVYAKQLADGWTY